MSVSWNSDHILQLPPGLTSVLDGREVEGHPLDQIHTLNEQDAQHQYALEGMDYGDGVLSGIRSRTRSNTDHIVINWEIDDPDNPHNWSTVNTTSQTHTLLYKTNLPSLVKPSSSPSQ